MLTRYMAPEFACFQEHLPALSFRKRTGALTGTSQLAGAPQTYCEERGVHVNGLRWTWRKTDERNGLECRNRLAPTPPCQDNSPKSRRFLSPLPPWTGTIQETCVRPDWKTRNARD